MPLWYLHPADEIFRFGGLFCEKSAVKCALLSYGATQPMLNVLVLLDETNIPTKIGNVICVIICDLIRFLVWVYKGHQQNTDLNV
jgi:hypothetical protein